MLDQHLAAFSLAQHGKESQLVAYLQSIDWRCCNHMVVVAQVHEDCYQITVLCVYLIPPQLPCPYLQTRSRHRHIQSDSPQKAVRRTLAAIIRKCAACGLRAIVPVNEKLLPVYLCLSGLQLVF